MALLAPPAVRPAPTPSMSMPSLPTLFNKPGPVRRRSTLKRSVDDADLMQIPSSPSKRSRVAFDPDIEILSADDDEDFDPLVVTEQVRRAIQRHLIRDDDSYERVTAVFGTPADDEHAPSTKVLRLHLSALLANVSALNQDCGKLVGAVLSSEWIGRDEKYFASFVKFLGNLAAAQTGYVKKIMQMLVDLLGPQKTRRISGSKLVRQPTIHRRALQTIRYITQLVPTASATLADRIAAKLEYDFQKGEERLTYIRSFMEIIKYIPELTSNILVNVITELIKLDVSIQVDLDEEADDVEDEILQHMSQSQTLALTATQDMLGGGLSDADDLSTTDESDMEEDEDLDPAIARRRKLKDDVKQVDMIMEVLFQYYSKLTTSTALQTRHIAIEQLIAQFHSLILPTYKSRHPQFLIFHFAQSDPVIVDRFVTSCVAVLIDKKQPQVLRHAAAAYFSGFVGRGKNVSPSVVQDCLDLLCDQLNTLRRQYESMCRGPDLKRFGDFYAMFQAVVYIFCFRWRDIASASSDLDDDSDVEEDEVEQYHFSETLREALHSAIYSPLNPLRICTTDIVDQFAEITRSLRFLYIYPKIEENKHVRVATRSRTISDLDINQPDLDRSWVGGDGMLQGYFPYDPYHLPISKHWIESDYVDWQGIPGQEKDNSESELDSEEEEEEDAAEDFEIVEAFHQ